MLAAININEFIKIVKIVNINLTLIFLALQYTFHFICLYSCWYLYYSFLLKYFTNSAVAASQQPWSQRQGYNTEKLGPKEATNQI